MTSHLSGSFGRRRKRGGREGRGTPKPPTQPNPSPFPSRAFDKSAKLPVFTSFGPAKLHLEGESSFYGNFPQKSPTNSSRRFPSVCSSSPSLTHLSPHPHPGAKRKSKGGGGPFPRLLHFPPREKGKEKEFRPLHREMKIRSRRRSTKYFGSSPLFSLPSPPFVFPRKRNEEIKKGEGDIASSSICDSVHPSFRSWGLERESEEEKSHSSLPFLPPISSGKK